MISRGLLNRSHSNIAPPTLRDSVSCFSFAASFGENCFLADIATTVQGNENELPHLSFGLLPAAGGNELHVYAGVSDRAVPLEYLRGGMSGRRKRDRPIVNQFRIDVPINNSDHART